MKNIPLMVLLAMSLPALAQDRPETVLDLYAEASVVPWQNGTLTFALAFGVVCGFWILIRRSDTLRNVIRPLTKSQPGG